MLLSADRRLKRIADARAWRAKNPDKTREYNKRGSVKWKAANPHYARVYARNRNLNKKYGLTSVQWDELFVSQGSCCASCGSDRPGGRYWHTDHRGPLPCTPADVR